MELDMKMLESDDTREWDIAFTPDDETPIPPGRYETECPAGLAGYRHLNFALKRQICPCGAVV